MKLKKSQLKEAVKAVVRQCLTERAMKEQVGADVVAGEEATPEPPVEQAPRYAEGDEIKLIKVMEHVAEILLSFHDVKEPEMGAEEPMGEPEPSPEPEGEPAPEGEPTEEPAGEEEPVAENVSSYNTGPSNRNAQYRVAPKHAYTDAEEDRARNHQTDPEITENNWIHGAVNPEHKGYCTPMSKATCTPHRKALAQRFKKGDIHHDNVDEAGLTSEHDHAMDQGEEIKLLKVIKHVCGKLLALHQGMPDAEEPAVDSPSMEMPPIDQGGEEPTAPEPEETPEPTEEPKEEPKKKKKKKDGDDPTEFTKKLAKESHKVQVRSYRTSDDMPNNPKNVNDPEIPGT